MAGLNQELSVVVMITIMVITEATFPWYQREYLDRIPQFQREDQPVYPSRFPVETQRFNFQPQRGFGFDPLTGRLIGFDPAPLDFHAKNPSTKEPTPTTIKSNFPTPTLRPADRKPTTQKRVTNNFQAGINNDIRLSDSPSTKPIQETEPKDACATVVCPHGTLCSVHSSQCSSPPCPDYAVCTKIQAIDSCKQPLVTGNCEYKYNSYYYNSLTGKCLPFVYTGCDGNSNRFSTLEQCQQVCVPSKKLCHLAMESGPCRAAKPRWYFNQEKQTCLEYIYGGCRGNSNNFETKTECMRMCSEE